MTSTSLAGKSLRELDDRTIGNPVSMFLGPGPGAGSKSRELKWLGGARKAGLSDSSFSFPFQLPRCFTPMP